MSMDLKADVIRARDNMNRKNVLKEFKMEYIKALETSSLDNDSKWKAFFIASAICDKLE